MPTPAYPKTGSSQDYSVHMSRPVKFFPAFTKHPANYPPMKESYCASCLVRPRVFEVTLPLDDGLYFIVYFNFLEQNGYTQATCYWGI